MGRKNRRQEIYQKRLISRKYKTRKVDVISRRSQPGWKREQEVRKLKPKILSQIGGNVSSSWIAVIEWRNTHAFMKTLDGYDYNVFIPFKVMEAWYYAHSKGTFFNYMIKDKYKVVRA